MQPETRRWKSTFKEENVVKEKEKKIWKFFLKKNSPAPGGVRTRDLRISSAPSAAMASTAYKYDALTDCATGARY